MAVIRQGTSTRGRQSIASPGAWKPPASEAKPDKRSDFAGFGQGGIVICHVCGADVTLKKATVNEIDRDSGVRVGDLVIGSHRLNGGRYSVRRGDPRCPAVYTHPIDITEEQQ